MFVDDHEIVRDGLKKLIEGHPEIDVVAAVSNGKKCLDLLDRLTPNVILMDISMPGISGIETTRLRCEKIPGIKIIMLTIFDDDHHVLESIEAGASGYVIKNIRKEDLLGIIKKVFEGRSFLDPNVTGPVLEMIRQPKQLEQDPKADLISDRQFNLQSFPKFACFFNQGFAKGDSLFHAMHLCSMLQITRVNHFFKPPGRP